MMIQRVSPGHFGATASPVSVLIPAYNHEHFVTDALESVLLDGYPDIEILIIDDGSTDETWNRISNWIADHSDVVSITADKQTNSGVGRTLNRLLGMARGKYVVPLASDDRLLPGGIAARVAFLEAQPSIAAVFGECRVIDAHGNVMHSRGVGRGSAHAAERFARDTAREIVENWSVPGPVVLYRREALKNAGGYSGDIAEDWEVYLRFASRREIAFIDVPVADYRWHAGNTAGDPAKAAQMADELSKVAWRSRVLFRGHLYLELVHESATWDAHAARLRGRRLAWAGLKMRSIALKCAAFLVPRRPSDQAGAQTAPRPQK